MKWSSRIAKEKGRANMKGILGLIRQGFKEFLSMGFLKINKMGKSGGTSCKNSGFRYAKWGKKRNYNSKPPAGSLGPWEIEKDQGQSRKPVCLQQRQDLGKDEHPSGSAHRQSSPNPEGRKSRDVQSYQMQMMTLKKEINRRKHCRG